jgi:hypothetical protein
MAARLTSLHSIWRGHEGSDDLVRADAMKTRC